jgi:hypothetical protein
MKIDDMTPRQAFVFGMEGTRPGSATLNQLARKRRICSEKGREDEAF